MKKKYRLYFILFLAVLPVVYLSFQVTHALHRSYKTQTALETTIQHTTEVRGVAVREEYALPFSGGVLRSTVQDGSRIEKGGLVGTTYPAGTPLQSVSLAEKVSARIAALEAAGNADVLAGTNIETVLGQVQQANYNWIAALDGGEYSALSAAGDAMVLYASRRQLLAGEGVSLAGCLADLSARLTTTAGTGALYCADAGYFCSRSDSFTGSLTYASVDSMSPAALSAFIQEGAGEKNAQVCAVQTSYLWRFYASVNAQQYAMFAQGDAAWLTFSQGADILSAKVLSTKWNDEDALGVVCFQLSTVNEHTVGLRTENVLVAQRAYSGLLVPKKALHVKDGQKIVFVRYGNTVQVKAVEPIFEDGENILLPSSPGAGNEVELYDEIIVEGKDLYDGKLLS